jgi:perosamine synthetase
LTTILKAKFTKGSRIAIPNFTFVATINAVLEAGMIPVIFGCHKDNWTIAIHSRDKDLFDGIIAVSPFGNSPDYTYWSEFSRQFNKPVVFDSAAGWGQDFNQTTAPISVSLHATKNLPIGEGGLIILDKTDSATAQLCESLISFGLDAAKQVRWKDGFNGKMDELHAAILLEQLSNPMIEIRMMNTVALVYSYPAALPEFDLYAPPPLTPQLPVFHVGGDMDLLMERAAKALISVRRYYWPLLNHVYPEYAVQGVNYNDEYFSKFIALPKDLDSEEYKYVIKALKG